MRSPLIGTVVALAVLGTSPLSAQAAPQDPFRAPETDSLLVKLRAMDFSQSLPKCPMPVLRLTPDGRSRDEGQSVAPFKQEGSEKSAPKFDGCVNPLDRGARPSWVPGS